METIQEQLASRLREFKKRGRKLGGKNKPKPSKEMVMPPNYLPPILEGSPKITVKQFTEIVSAKLEYSARILKRLSNDFRLEAYKKPDRKESLHTCELFFAFQEEGIKQAIKILKEAMPA